MKDIELVQVVWESTYRCPSNCVFCYNCWKYEYKQDPEMDLDQLKMVLKKLPKFNRFVISGGEPLLRNDLEDIIEEARKYTDNVTILTSGILIDDLIANLFKKHDIFVQIPFHGLEKTHNELTRVENGYNRAIKGVAHLRKHNVRFATTTVANKMNIHELKQVFELGVALGASELQVIRFMPGGEGMKNAKLMLNKNEYEQMLDSLNSICARYRIPGAIGAPNLPCLFPEKKYKHITMGSCSAGIDWLVIDPSPKDRICKHSTTILGDLIEHQ